jgi:hypothetical protein
MTTDDKWYILYSETYDRRGILVTTGRYFHLLQDGAYAYHLDLGVAAMEGEPWCMTQIAHNRVMLTSNKFAPRILQLNQDADSSATTDVSLAGLIAPVKPPEIESQDEDDSQEVKSWRMQAVNSKGVLDPGDYRVLVRGVNHEDALESEFVPVYDDSDADNRDITAIQDDAISVYMEDAAATGGEYDSYAPPLHERMTHIQVWRTLADGATYYLESEIELARLNHNEDTSSTPGIVDVVPGLDPEGYPIRLSDSEALGLTPITAADLAAGGLPPICKQAVSLQGVTLCFGKADDPNQTATAYSRFLHLLSGDDQGDAFTLTGAFTNYVYADGDLLEVVYPVARRRITPIDGKTSANEISLDAANDGSNPGTHAVIKRPYTIEYPTIDSDEDCWYSRTDKFAPESFPTRTLRISDIGDTFMYAINVQNYVAVIMRNGVHLLYLSGSTLTKDTIANYGEGTPWENSVVTLGNKN